MSYEIIETGENYRKFKFFDKEVTLNREDPHGLWIFHWETGSPPAALSGSFTNVGTAVEFLTNYLTNLTPAKRKTLPTKE